MKAMIIKIGNSRGIRLPKVLLEESNLGNEVELSLKKNAIVISPVKKPRVAKLNEEYVMSLNALKDWEDPKEDEAWKDL